MKTVSMNMPEKHKGHLSCTGNFEVQIIEESIVKADTQLPQPILLSLSNLDLLSGRFPVSYFYFYRKPECDNFSGIVRALKRSLAQALNHYYPFAGQIVQNPKTDEPEIVCNNNGALVVEADANIPLKELDFYDLNASLQGKLVSVHPNFPLQIQVTHYICGGISITFTFDHALGDASAFGKFMGSWCELAQGKVISCTPDHSRNLHARFPPRYQPSLDQNFLRCTMEDIVNIPITDISVKRLYHIKEPSIIMLQRLASGDGRKRTKIEAFSAYVWKIIATTIDEINGKCKMGWLVDGRERICDDRNSMSNYIGNVLSLGFGEATTQELKEASISDVSNVVHEAISKVTKKDHFLDLIDWIECHRPGLMLSKVVLGQGGSALVVSSGRRFPVGEVDFGFGRPVLGTVCSSIERIGVGYMNQRESALGDGSWTISAILWPKLAAALESDPLFHPMSATHLQI